MKKKKTEAVEVSSRLYTRSYARPINTARPLSVVPIRKLRTVIYVDASSLVIVGRF